MKGINSHLLLKDRHTCWDVRYLGYFKTEVEGMPQGKEYTLKMLFEGKSRQWLDKKSAPMSIHVLLCSIVEQ